MTEVNCYQGRNNYQLYAQATCMGSKSVMLSMLSGKKRQIEPHSVYIYGRIWGMGKMVVNQINLRRRGNNARTAVTLNKLEGFTPVELEGIFPFDSSNTPGRKFQIGIWSGSLISDNQIFWTISVNNCMYQVLVTYRPPSGDGLTGASIESIEAFENKAFILEVTYSEDVVVFRGKEEWEASLPMSGESIEINAEVVQNVLPEHLVLIDGNLHRGLLEWYNGILDPSIPVPRMLAAVAVVLCCVKAEVSYESGGKWKASIKFDCTCLS